MTLECPKDADKLINFGWFDKTFCENNIRRLNEEYPECGNIDKQYLYLGHIKWTISEDDNRSNLESCRLRVQDDMNSTSLTIGWSEPVNASSNTFYRLEIAGDEEFTTGYAAFPNLKETLFKIEDLTPNTAYYIRLQAYLGPDLGPNDVTASST